MKSSPQSPVPLKADSIFYGADYNPEQWPEGTVERDIELMKAAGVNLVTVGVFSWALLEPEPGRYEFGWLRDVMDKMYEAGIGVDLATGTASPPPWLGSLYPETLPINVHGEHLSWGSRQQYNPSSQLFRDKVAALVKAMAAAFGDHPGLKMWHVSNEYGCHIDESFDHESVERFRAWLGERYGSLDALNQAWGTAFWSQRMTSWDQVLPPVVTPTIPNQHQQVDWRIFWSENILDLFLIEKEALRTANPDIPITTNFMDLWDSLDYWRWAEHMDVISNDSYPDPANPRAAREYALHCDLMRSFGGGRPFIQMEQTPSSVQWRRRNPVKRPGQYGLWSMQAVARGANGIMNFQWRQSLAGAETFHGAMVPHGGTETRTWREVTQLGEALSAIEPPEEGAAQADVVLLWDWESAWNQQYACGPVDERVPENELRAWHASLFERHQVVDFAHPESDLTSYRVIIVPALFRLTPAAVARLLEAVAGGASVIVTYQTGYVGPDGHAIEGGYLGNLASLLGVRVQGLYPVSVEPTVLGFGEDLDHDVDHISSSIHTPAASNDVVLRAVDGASFSGKGADWGEVLAVDPDAGVEVIAEFAADDLAGLPVVTVRRGSGAGEAWYVATRLDSAGRAAVLDQVLGVAPAVPRGVDITERGQYIFLLNHGDHEAIVEGDHHVAPRSCRVLLAEG